jgi:hypothetical protein
MYLDNFVIQGERAVVVSLPGDYNGHGAADAADFSASCDGRTLMNEGSSPGTVHQASYDLWRARFGARTTGLGTAQVPKPTSVAIEWCAMAFLLAATRAKPRRTAQCGCESRAKTVTARSLPTDEKLPWERLS